MITTYEVMLLVPSTHSDSKIKTAIEGVKSQIKSLDGEIVFEDNFGKRTLTYPINKEESAYYHYLHFKMAGEKNTKLEAFLKLDKNILRHLITKLPEGYQSRKDQHLVEIVEDIVNFGENKSKKTTSHPIPNPDRETSKAKS